MLGAGSYATLLTLNSRARDLNSGEVVLLLLKSNILGSSAAPLLKNLLSLESFTCTQQPSHCFSC